MSSRSFLKRSRYLGANLSKSVVTAFFKSPSSTAAATFIPLRELICHLLLPFSQSFDVVTYLSNFEADSEFVKVVMHLGVLIRKEFFTVRISPPLRMTDLCVCVCFRNHIIRPHLISRWGSGIKGLLQSRPNVGISQVGMTETTSKI